MVHSASGVAGCGKTVDEPERSLDVTGTGLPTGAGQRAKEISEVLLGRRQRLARWLDPRVLLLGLEVLGLRNVNVVAVVAGRRRCRPPAQPAQQPLPQ
jgi:hypothetical protein